MKSFYSPVAVADFGPVAGVALPDRGDRGPSATSSICVRARARIAIYDAMSAAPRVIEIDPQPVPQFIEELAARVHELCRDEGGPIPYTVIREVIENFIHADFSEPVVSILDGGSTIRFADQGPGIGDKERVLLPGFTTARGDMKRYIRGVGSGLPIVREFLVHSGGSLAIEDNLGTGSVVTVYAGPRRRVASAPARDVEEAKPAPEPSDANGELRQFALYPEPAPPLGIHPRLSARQKQVLALVLESGIAGPSLISKELGMGVSTAYRDLALLEEFGLISSDVGKRTLTAEGLAYLGTLMNGQ